MSTENLDLIRRGYEAFGRGDIITFPDRLRLTPPRCVFG